MDEPLKLPWHMCSCCMDMYRGMNVEIEKPPSSLMEALQEINDAPEDS